MDGYQQATADEPSASPERVMVTLEFEADVLGWLQEQPLWRREINALLRAYMEVNLIRETAFEDLSPEALAKGEAAADQQEE